MEKLGLTETMKYFEVMIPQLTPKRFAKWLSREVDAWISPPIKPIVDKGKTQLLLESFVFKLTEPKKSDWEAHYLQIDAHPSVAVKGQEVFGNPTYLVQGWGESIPAVVMIEMRDDDGQVHIIGECKDYMDSYVQFLLTRLKHIYPEARAIQPFATQSESYLMWSEQDDLEKKQKIELHVEDIDSFSLAGNIKPQDVKDLLPLNLAEDYIQRSLEEIIGENFHQQDWGGELNDLVTSHVKVNGKRLRTVFLLKGKGTRGKLTISKCGKNGDQILRLVGASVDLYVIQHVDAIDQQVIYDLKGKVELEISQGHNCQMCILDGTETARILKAYGKL